MDSLQLRFLWSMIRPGTDFLRADYAGIHDSSNRWGLFAVAASGISVSSQEAVDLYVARLRKRRASPVNFAHGRRKWLRDSAGVKSRGTQRL